MKNKSYIGISLIILVFGIIFIPKILDRISKGSVVEADRLNIDKKAENPELVYITQYGERKRVPDFKFVNQEGDTITNKDYLGKVYVVDFFFTTCPSICPIMSENLVEIQNQLKGRENFGIVSITIDPQHDTPEVLKQYAEEHKVFNPNWNFLTGDRQNIYDMANRGFGIFAEEDETIEGGFAHSGLFALIDQDGYVRSRQDKFGNPIIYYRGSIKSDASLVEGEEAPEIDILIEDIKKLL